MKKQESSKISRRDFIKTSAGIAATAMTLPSSLLSGVQSSTPKNIVFIISDQHRWDVTGCYGNQYIDTPNIDRLASEGVRFENMYCQFPLCVPSRQSIITSQYASTHGTRKNNVPEDQDTLVDYLRDSYGYHTWLSGKSHMTTKAFDIYIDKGNLDGYLSQEIIDARDNADSWYNNQYDGFEGKETRKKINTQYLLYPLIENWHRESLFVSMAEKILTEHSERPTFFWISFIKPHPKWTPPERFWKKYRHKDLPTPEPATSDIIGNLPRYLQQTYYDRNLHLLNREDITNSVKAYYACTEYVDYVVGLILDLLGQHNLAQDTLVVYTADHGEMLGHNGLYFKSEKGLITPDDVDDFQLSWGETDKIRELVEMIAFRRGIGSALADGATKFPKHFTEEAQKLVMQVKGLDIICGDPRGIKAYGLTYAIASRGAGHLRAEPYFELTNRNTEAKKRFGTEKAADRLAEEGKAALVAYSEKIALLTDCLTMCKNIGLCMDVLNLENAAATTNFGLLMTIIGVAVGLGAVWRFPYMVGKFGGAAFILFYMAVIFFIGIPALMAEWTLGRYTNR